MSQFLCAEGKFIASDKITSILPVWNGQNVNQISALILRSDDAQTVVLRDPKTIGKLIRWAASRSQLVGDQDPRIQCLLKENSSSRIGIV